MKPTSVIIAVLLLLGGAAVAYRFAAANDEEKPIASNAVVSTAPPGTPSPFGSGPAATVEPSAPQATPPTPPPVAPTPVPPPIAKALAAARAQAPARAMNQLAKNWFGCASEDGYNATLDLIKQKSATSGDHFHGPEADCAPLPTGTHISIMRVDNSNGMAQISVDDTHKVYWTDSEALAGDPARK